jgi:hypothetical protein
VRIADPVAGGAELAYYDPTPDRRRASRAAIGIAVAFYVVAIGAMFGVSIAHGYGTGFGDGRLAQSCFTPGGPYYPPGLPAAERTCPQGPAGRSGQRHAGPLEHPVPDIARIVLSLGAAASVMVGWIWLLRTMGSI